MLCLAFGIWHFVKIKHVLQFAKVNQSKTAVWWIQRWKKKKRITAIATTINKQQKQRYYNKNHGGDDIKANGTTGSNHSIYVIQGVNNNRRHYTFQSHDRLGSGGASNQAINQVCITGDIYTSILFSWYFFSSWIDLTCNYLSSFCQHTISNHNARDLLKRLFASEVEETSDEAIVKMRELTGGITNKCMFDKAFSWMMYVDN